MYPYVIRIFITLINFLLQTFVYTKLSNLESSEYYRLIAIQGLIISFATAGIQNYIAVNYAKENNPESLAKNFVEINIIAIVVTFIFLFTRQISLYLSFFIIMNAISYYFASIINAKGNPSLYLFLINGFNSSIAIVCILIFQNSGQLVFTAYTLGGLFSLLLAAFILKNELKNILVKPLLIVLKKQKLKFITSFLVPAKSRINHYIIDISNGWFLFGFLSIFSIYHKDISQIAISLKYSTILFLISTIEQLKTLPKLSKVKNSLEKTSKLIKNNLNIIIFTNFLILFSIYIFYAFNLLPSNINEIVSSDLFIYTVIIFLLISLTIPSVSYDMTMKRESTLAYFMLAFLIIDLINIVNPIYYFKTHFFIHLMLFLSSYSLSVIFNRIKYRNL